MRLSFIVSIICFLLTIVWWCVKPQVQPAPLQVVKVNKIEKVYRTVFFSKWISNQHECSVDLQRLCFRDKNEGLYATRLIVAYIHIDGPQVKSYDDRLELPEYLPTMSAVLRVIEQNCPNPEKEKAIRRIIDIENFR